MFERARRLVEEIEAGGNERDLTLDLKSCLNQLGIYPVPGNLPELFAVAGHSATLAGDIDSAKWFLARAVEQGAASAETLGHYASILAGSGDYAQASHFAERALKLSPDARSRSWFHGLSGFICLCRGDEAGSLKHYSLAVQENPDNSSARYGLGCALLAAGRGREAVVQLHVALEGDPRNQEAWYALGQAALRSKDPALARKALERTAALGKSTPSVLKLRLAAALVDGEDAEVEQLLSRVATDSYGSFEKSEVLIEAAELLAEWGYPAEAEARLQSFVAAEPSNPNANAALAEQLMRQHRFNEAVPYLKATVELLPACGPYWYQLGFAAMRSGDVPLAGAALNKALQLRPEDVEVWNELTGYYSVIGHDDETLRWATKALAHSPDNPTANYNLALFLFDADRPAEALPYVERAIELRSEPKWRGLLAQVLIELERFLEAARVAAELAGTSEHEPAHFLWILSQCESGNAEIALARAQDEVVARPESSIIWAALALAAWYNDEQMLYQDSLSHAQKLGRDDSWVAWAVALTSAERP